ncbi:MAG: dynamin family protein [Fimbriimonadaceae bacterium]
MASILENVVQDGAGQLGSILFGANGELTWRWVQDRRKELVQTVEAVSLRERLPFFATSTDEALENPGKPFEVFIVGSVKFGKSTLINALLGQVIAPTGRYPKTWCFNRYIAVDRPSEHARVLVEPRLFSATPALVGRFGNPKEWEGDLGVFRLTPRDVERLIAEEEQKTVASLNTANPYVSPIIEIEWQVPASRAVLKGIRLVDTMGLNGIREKKGHLNRLTWQFRRADAVIWVVSATNLNDAGIREQLHEFRRFAKRSVLVVNRWDEVTKKEAVRDRAVELYSPFVHETVFLSALAAEVAVNRIPLNSLLGEQKAAVMKLAGSPIGLNYDDLLQASGFPQLRRVLEERLQKKQREVRIEAAYNRLRTEQADCRRMASTLAEELHSNLALLTNLRECLRSSVAEATETVRANLDGCLAELQARVSKDLELLTYESLSDPRSVVDVQAYQNRLRAEQQRTCEAVEAIFAKLANRASAYVKVEFATDGGVAEQLAFPSLGAIQLKIDPVALGVALPHLSKGTANQVWDFLSSVPILGGIFEALDMLFGGLARRANKVQEGRERIRQALLPKMGEAIDEMEGAFKGEIVRLQDLAGGDIEAHARRYGQEEEILDRLRRLREFLASPEPPPLWVELTLKALKRHRWRKSS